MLGISKSHGVIVRHFRVYDEADNVIETHEQMTEFKDC
jgi:hypothetical protein